MSLDAGGVGHVSGDRERVELVGHPARSVASSRAAIATHAPGLAERAGERLPKALDSAGDDGDLAVEPGRESRTVMALDYLQRSEGTVLP